MAGFGGNLLAGGVHDVLTILTPDTPLWTASVAAIVGGALLMVSLKMALHYAQAR